MSTTAMLQAKSVGKSGEGVEVRVDVVLGVGGFTMLLVYIYLN